jgi:hypothetical protein
MDADHPDKIKTTHSDRYAKPDNNTSSDNHVNAIGDIT